MSTTIPPAGIPSQLVNEFTNRINALSKTRQHAYWYVKRAEEYLQATQRRPVSEHTRAEVEGYFSELGRNATLSNWQFRQGVEAVGGVDAGRRGARPDGG